MDEQSGESKQEEVMSEGIGESEMEELVIIFVGRKNRDPNFVPGYGQFCGPGVQSVCACLCVRRITFE